MGIFYTICTFCNYRFINAVNLTDGLDGLATVPVMLVALSFTLISYVGNTIFRISSFTIHPDVGEISIFVDQ